MNEMIIFSADGNLPRELNPFGDHLKPVSAAVMLSPPVRRSRVMEPEREGALSELALTALFQFLILFIL